MISTFLLLNTVFAQEPKSLVMVAPVRSTQSAEKAGDGLAWLLRKKLREDGLGVAIVDKYIASVNDEDSAEEYLDSCMAADGKGYRVCVQLIAEANKWDYAISIEVFPTQTGFQVQAWIIDVFQDKQISTPALNIQKDGFSQWATIVAATYKNVLKNGIQSNDNRKKDNREEEILDNERLKEIGEGFDEISSDDLPDIDQVASKREDLTKEDIAKMALEDVPPWEEIGLTGKQYLEFYNAQNRNRGFTLSKWKQRMNGKFGYLTLGVSGGYSFLPSKGSYYGYRLRSSDLSATLETYAEQTIQNAGLGLIEFSAGVGILPQVELVGFYGIGSSKYDVSLWWITIDNNQPSNLDTDVTQSISYFGARANVSLPSLKNLRPVLGASATIWQGNSGYDYFGQPELQAEFPDLGAPSMLVLAAEPGLEIRTGERVDVWVRVPITYSIVQNSPSSVQSVDELQYQDRLSIEGHSPLGYGVMTGLRIYVPVFTPNFSYR